MDVLSKDEISLYLDDKRAENVDVLKTIDSTNMELARRATRGAKDGAVVISDTQTQGKGRRGRVFYSPEKSGLYLSYLFRPQASTRKKVADMGGEFVWTWVTSWTAVAVCDAIEEVCRRRPRIKWVNDLYMNHKKISGILTQASTSQGTENIEHMIIGIGVNVSQVSRDFPRELREKAGSIYTETGRRVNRAKLAACIIGALDAMVGDFPSNEEYYYKKYVRDNIVPGKNIEVISGDKKRLLKALRIERDYTLIVRNEDGDEERIMGEDVSIKL